MNRRRRPSASSSTFWDWSPSSGVAQTWVTIVTRLRSTRPAAMWTKASITTPPTRTARSPRSTSTRRAWMGLHSSITRLSRASRYGWRIRGRQFRASPPGSRAADRYLRRTGAVLRRVQRGLGFQALRGAAGIVTGAGGGSSQPFSAPDLSAARPASCAPVIVTAHVVRYTWQRCTSATAFQSRCHLAMSYG